MKNLIIAHSSEVLASSLEDALKTEWNIHISVDSYAAADMLKYIQSDALIVDINIPPQGGLKLLSDCKPQLPPVILATTNLITPPILRSAESLGVGCIIPVPCSTAYVKEQLQELTNKRDGERNGYNL